MLMKPTVGCVILAAGSGSRFGGDKLSALFRGRPLYEHAMDAVPASLQPQTVVVTGQDVILCHARERGFRTVVNDRPELGISRSIRLGTEEMGHCGALLYLVCDQPLLTRDVVEQLLRRYIEYPDKIIVPADKNSISGNPCLFPARFFPELCALEGDRGGKKVIAAHPEAVEYVTVETEALTDTDFKSELDRLEKTGN